MQPDPEDAATRIKQRAESRPVNNGRREWRGTSSAGLLALDLEEAASIGRKLVQSAIWALEQQQ